MPKNKGTLDTLKQAKLSINALSKYRKIKIMVCLLLKFNALFQLRPYFCLWTEY